MTQAPFASVAIVRVNPVSVCVAVTVTPGRTAPLSSVTRPFEFGGSLRPREGAGEKKNERADDDNAKDNAHGFEPAALGFPSGWCSSRSLGYPILVPSCFVTLPSHAYAWPGRGNPSTVTMSPTAIESPSSTPSRTSQAAGVVSNRHTTIFRLCRPLSRR